MKILLDRSFRTAGQVLGVLALAVGLATAEETPPKVVNLMDALRQSLDRVSSGKKKAAKAEIEKPAKAAPKKRAAR